MPGAVERANASRVHGGVCAAELNALRLGPERVVDFSVSCNPYGPHPDMLRALRDVPVTRYPSPRADPARRALAQALAVDCERIALGNGACELLWTVARCLVQPGDAVVVAEPAFGELRAAVERAGARVVEVRARPETGFALDLEATLAAVEATAARALYLCTPSTPAGTAVPARALAEAARAHPRATFIVDQSFLALSERFADAAVEFPDNAVLIRSLTKEHTIPGVRVGYLLAAPECVRALDLERPAWPVGAHAQAAAAAAATPAAARFVADSRTRLFADRARLAEQLRALGVAAVPSTTCYLLAQVGDAAALRARLLARHGIVVRDCSSFGLPAHVRLAARPAPDCDRLIAALRQELDR